MSNRLFFDDLEIGDKWTSQGRTITETDVVSFAGLTGDYDPLHVDREHAASTPFGKPIAHGLLGLSFVAGLGSHSPSVATLAFISIQNWEFRRPAHIGDTVHVRTEVMDKQTNGRRCGSVTWKRELINNEGLVVQTGIFETLVSTKLVKPPRDATTSSATAPYQAETPTGR